MAERTCSECGAEDYWTNYDKFSKEKAVMDELGVCWDCAYWHVLLREKHETVIDGRLYHVGSRPRGAGGNGMGGRRFDIEYFDGRKVTTYDLWAGSDIPDKHRSRVPNTARFVNGGGEHKVGDATCWDGSRE